MNDLTASQALETRITLACTAGVHKGRSYTFSGHDTFLIGRSSKAHFRLPTDDRYFSRVHFMVEFNPPLCKLIDMGSRNGTFVNDVRVESEMILKNGDKIRAGRTLLEVSFDEWDVDVASAAPISKTSALAKIPAHADTVGSPPHATVPATSAGCPLCHAPRTVGAKLCDACQKLGSGLMQPVAGYQVLRELGRGGMGVVYLAFCDANQTSVALKTITPSQGGNTSQVERFLREARILQQLVHPNIVGFQDTGVCDGQFYFAMDYINGDDASKILKRGGRVDTKRAVSWTCQLLQALDYAHAKGFVHRDIKPANLLIEDVGSGREIVHLADFGLARVYQESPLSGLTLQGDIAGTYAYMAPEQITSFRESKPSVDLYSTAATLFHLLTCRYVFDLPKSPSARIKMILDEEPKLISSLRGDIPEQLAQVIQRGLLKDPEKRYPDAASMRRALAAFQ